MSTLIQAGDKVQFQSPLSNGGMARWTASVVSVTDGIARVRHPEAARSFPFSPVATPGLYLYHASALRKVAR